MVAPGCSGGGVHGKGGMRGEGGHVWQRGACMVKGGMHGEGGGMVKGACMAKGEHAWQRGACMAKGGHVWRKMGCGEREGGHAWYAPPRDTASHCAGGTHPTGMHSCLLCVLKPYTFILQ